MTVLCCFCLHIKKLKILVCRVQPRFYPGPKWHSKTSSEMLVWIPSRTWEEFCSLILLFLWKWNFEWYSTERERDKCSDFRFFAFALLCWEHHSPDSTCSSPSFSSTFGLNVTFPVLRSSYREKKFFFVSPCPIDLLLYSDLYCFKPHISTTYYICVFFSPICMSQKVNSSIAKTCFNSWLYPQHLEQCRP